MAWASEAGLPHPGDMRHVPSVLKIRDILVPGPLHALSARSQWGWAWQVHGIIPYLSCAQNPRYAGSLAAAEESCPSSFWTIDLPSLLIQTQDKGTVPTFPIFACHLIPSFSSQVAVLVGPTLLLPARQTTYLPDQRTPSKTMRWPSTRPRPSLKTVTSTHSQQ